MDGESSYVSEDDLKYMHLFRYVDLESVRGLIDACTTRTLQPEEILITPGEINHIVYLLLSGTLRVHLNSLDSEPIMINPGESVGEMSALDHQPASAYVVADEICRLFVMNEDILWSLVRSSHPAACNLLFTLIRRLRQTDSLAAGETFELEEIFQHYGSWDALTGLHSHYWLDNILDRLFNRAMSKGNPLSLIMIDIDKFREFNERHGQSYGDRVLYSVAHTLTESLRPMEVIARYGGDEFLVVLPEVEITTARKIAERLHHGVINAVPIMPSGETVPHPTISIGIAQLGTEEDPEMLVNSVEGALSRARQNGGNCISE